MSVHTLTVSRDTGMVAIAANVTKGEALDAGPQILRFCYEINDQPPPIVLDRPDPEYHAASATPIGQLSVQDGAVTLAHVCPLCHKTSRSDMDPTSARAVASLIAVMADHAESGLDPAEVHQITSHFPEATEDEIRAFLTRFELKERA